MIREFARNIVTVQAFNAVGRKLTIDKTDKDAWQTAPHDGPITLCYEVYGWDLSVRAAHLDDTIVFFNGTSVFLAVEGQADAVSSIFKSLRARNTRTGGWRRQCPRRVVRSAMASARMKRRITMR